MTDITAKLAEALKAMWLNVKSRLIAWWHESDEDLLG